MRSMSGETLHYLKKPHLKILFYLMIKEAAPALKVLKVARTRSYDYISELKTLGLVDVIKSPLLEPYTIVILTDKGRLFAEKLFTIASSK